MQIITNLRNKHKESLIELAENAISELVEVVVHSKLSIDEVVKISEEISAIGAHLKMLKSDEQPEGVNKND